MDEEDFMEEQMYDNIESNMSNSKLRSPYSWYKMIYESFESKTDTKNPVEYFNTEFNTRSSQISSKTYFINKVNEYLDDIIEVFKKIAKEEELYNDNKVEELKSCIYPILEKQDLLGFIAYNSFDSYGCKTTFKDVNSPNDLLFACDYSPSEFVSYSQLLNLKDVLTISKLDEDNLNKYYLAIIDSFTYEKGKKPNKHLDMYFDRNKDNFGGTKEGYYESIIFYIKTIIQTFDDLKGSDAGEVDSVEYIEVLGSRFYYEMIENDGNPNPPMISVFSNDGYGIIPTKLYFKTNNDTYLNYQQFVDFMADISGLKVDTIPDSNRSVNNENLNETKSKIEEQFKIEIGNWNVVFEKEADYSTYIDLLANFFEGKNYKLPSIINVKRKKGKIRAFLKAIYFERIKQNLNKNFKFHDVIKVLSCHSDWDENGRNNFLKK